MGKLANTFFGLALLYAIGYGVVWYDTRDERNKVKDDLDLLKQNPIQNQSRIDSLENTYNKMNFITPLKSFAYYLNDLEIFK